MRLSHVTQEQLHPLLVIAPFNPQARNEKVKYNARNNVRCSHDIMHPCWHTWWVCCAVMVGWVWALQCKVLHP